MKDYAEGKVSSDCCVGEMHRRRRQKMALGEHDRVPSGTGSGTFIVTLVVSSPNMALPRVESTQDSTIADTTIAANVDIDETVIRIDHRHQNDALGALVVKIFRPCTGHCLHDDVLPINGTDAVRELPSRVEAIRNLPPLFF